MEGCPMFMDRNNIINMTAQPKAIHGCSAISLKISKALLIEVKKQS